MTRSLTPIAIASALLSVGSATLLGAPVAQAARPAVVQQQQEAPQSPELIRRGAKRSFAIRTWHGMRRMVEFPTQIQHVVVIDMENRSVDDIFAAYWGHSWQKSNTVEWQNVMNIANPAGPPALTPNPLSTAAAYSFDPNHEHDGGFLNETLNGFGSETFGCSAMPCPPNATAYSYVPIPGADPYAQLAQNYASADEVFQANEGPSMPSHQYLIAGQTGGIPGSFTYPLAIASNPGSKNTQGNYLETGDPDGGKMSAYCAGGTQPKAPALNMTTGRQPAFTTSYQAIQPPCETYTSGTILDEMVTNQGTPPYDDWQYVGHQIGGFWSAPTAVANLYAQYTQGNVNTQPFAIDPNAYNFVQSLQGTGNPQRPFATLTYITPCSNTSDHPSASGSKDYGPQWLGTVVNAIGTSRYWSSTIIVTWDDWGGFYDHVPFVESAHNPYGNPADPNEWGFRVPFIVISPYVSSVGYVSHGPGGTLGNPTPRSQSAILTFIETIFDLPSLKTDDSANDNLLDMFNFNNFVPFTPVTGLSSYQIPSTC